MNDRSTGTTRGVGAAAEHLSSGISSAATLGLDTSAAEALADSVDAEPAAARIALRDLAEAAGIEGPVRDLVIDRHRRRAIDAAVSRVAALLDMQTLELGAVAHTRARARTRGSGPLAPIASAIDRWSLRRRAAALAAEAAGDTVVAAGPWLADGALPAAPAEHLRDWRTRGDLSEVLDLLGKAVDDSLPAMSPAIRPAYAATVDRDELGERLAAALDRVIAREAPEAAAPPTSAAWTFIGLLQWVNAFLLVLGVAWTSLWLAGSPAPSQKLVLLGSVPLPPLVLVTALLVGMLLVFALGRHADRLGRRWSRRLEVLSRIGARQVIEGHAFTRVDRLESARLRLASAVRAVW